MINALFLNTISMEYKWIIYIYFLHDNHGFISFLVDFETKNVKTYNLIYKCFNLRFDLYKLRIREGLIKVNQLI